jgi:hypothetical protein
MSQTRHPYWVRFTGHAPACVMAASPEAAKEEGAKLLNLPAISAQTLPYPAPPVLNHQQGDCPDFCYTPEQCVGNSCCRKSYACSE